MTVWLEQDHAGAAVTAALHMSICGQHSSVVVCDLICLCVSHTALLLICSRSLPTDDVTQR
jgi:hypothetical protein